jgi:hypothetical protein
MVHYTARDELPAVELDIERIEENNFICISRHQPKTKQSSCSFISDR